MAERKVYPVNPKHQYLVSQCKEHDFSTHYKKDRDYCEYPSLTHSQMNINYKEHGGKESCSSKY